MIFVETRLFTTRILDAMSDDEYAGLQNHLSQHPDAGALKRESDRRSEEVNEGNCGGI